MQFKIAIIAPVIVSALLFFGFLAVSSTAQATSQNLQAAYNNGYNNGYSWGAYDQINNKGYGHNNRFHGHSCFAMLPDCYYQRGFNIGYDKGYEVVP